MITDKQKKLAKTVALQASELSRLASAFGRGEEWAVGAEERGTAFAIGIQFSILEVWLDKLADACNSERR